MDDFGHLSQVDPVELSHEIEHKTTQAFAGKNLSEPQATELRWKTAAQVTSDWAGAKLNNYCDKKGDGVSRERDDAFNLVDLQYGAKQYLLAREQYLSIGGESGRIDIAG